MWLEFGLVPPSFCYSVKALENLRFKDGFRSLRRDKNATLGCVLEGLLGWIYPLLIYG
jgi:hypothetical protein